MPCSAQNVPSIYSKNQRVFTTTCAARLHLDFRLMDASNRFCAQTRLPVVPQRYISFFFASRGGGGGGGGEHWVAHPAGAEASPAELS